MEKDGPGLAEVKKENVDVGSSNCHPPGSTNTAKKQLSSENCITSYVELIESVNCMLSLLRGASSERSMSSNSLHGIIRMELYGPKSRGDWSNWKLHTKETRSKTMLVTVLWTSTVGLEHFL